jgi:hypothetical protein
MLGKLFAAAEDPIDMGPEGELCIKGPLATMYMGMV